MREYPRNGSVLPSSGRKTLRSLVFSVDPPTSKPAGGTRGNDSTSQSETSDQDSKERKRILSQMRLQDAEHTCQLLRDAIWDFYKLPTAEWLKLHWHSALRHTGKVVSEGFGPQLNAELQSAMHDAAAHFFNDLGKVEDPLTCWDQYILLLFNWAEWHRELQKYLVWLDAKYLHGENKSIYTEALIEGTRAFIQHDNNSSVHTRISGAFGSSINTRDTSQRMLDRISMMQRALSEYKPELEHEELMNAMKTGYNFYDEFRESSQTHLRYPALTYLQGISTSSDTFIFNRLSVSFQLNIWGDALIKWFEWFNSISAYVLSAADEEFVIQQFLSWLSLREYRKWMPALSAVIASLSVTESANNDGAFSRAVELLASLSRPLDPKALVDIVFDVAQALDDDRIRKSYDAIKRADWLLKSESYVEEISQKAGVRRAFLEELDNRNGFQRVRYELRENLVLMLYDTMRSQMADPGDVLKLQTEIRMLRIPMFEIPDTVPIDDIAEPDIGALVAVGLLPKEAGGSGESFEREQRALDKFCALAGSETSTSLWRARIMIQEAETWASHQKTHFLHLTAWFTDDLEVLEGASEEGLLPHDIDLEIAEGTSIKWHPDLSTVAVRLGDHSFRVTSRQLMIIRKLLASESPVPLADLSADEDLSGPVNDLLNRAGGFIKFSKNSYGIDISLLPPTSMVPELI